MKLYLGDLGLFPEGHSYKTHLPLKVASMVHAPQCTCTYRSAGGSNHIAIVSRRESVDRDINLSTISDFGLVGVPITLAKTRFRLLCAGNVQGCECGRHRHVPILSQNENTDCLLVLKLQSKLAVGAGRDAGCGRSKICLRADANCLRAQPVNVHLYDTEPDERYGAIALCLCFITNPMARGVTDQLR